MTAHPADRNLLFGVLALQAGLIDSGQFAQACSLWATQKDRPLAEILLGQGWLTPEDQSHLEHLLQRNLRKHAGDAHASLAELATDRARDALAAVRDPDVQQSLAGLPPGGPSLPPTLDWPTENRHRYTLARLHARGGIGQVWVARDEDLGREVALKELRPEKADSPAARARFIEEAKVTGQLEHPGIVPIYELVRRAEDQRVLYTMRLVRGRTLADAARSYHRRRRAGEAGPLELRELLGAFVAVCNAVAYAHSRAVLHRDLKPQNVVLGDFGEVIVLDWGLAKVRGEAGADTDLSPVALVPEEARVQTVQGQVLGTPAYMAPEQAEGRLERVGQWSDIYGLGAVLYELLTGGPPFEGGSTEELLRRVVHESPVPPRQRVASVPRALEAVCLKALARRPEDRYRSAGELAREVQHWLADEPVLAYREPLRVRVGRWARRHKPLVSACLAAALVALLLGGAGAWWLERQRLERTAEQARRELQRRQGVESALAELARLHRQGGWAEAGAVLKQAEGRLGEDAPGDLRGRLAQARRDFDLVLRLDGIRLRQASWRGGQFATAAADREYAAAFAEAGLGRVEESAEAVAGRVKGSTVRGALVAALDDWASCAEGPARRVWVLEVARRADPEPRRLRFRDPATWWDRAAVERLAREAPVADLSPPLLASLGTRLGMGREAERLMLRAVARYPGDFWLNFGMGNSLLTTKPEEAVGYYRAALALRPGTAAVHNNLGVALKERGRLDEAIAEYRKALAADPNLAPARVSLGGALKERGRSDEAIAEYRKAIAAEPDYAEGHYNLGNALLTHRVLEEAAAELRLAVKGFSKRVSLRPKLAMTYGALGSVLFLQGKFTEADEVLRHALRLFPAGDPVRKRAVSQLRRCQRMLALQEKLPAILNGRVEPADLSERLALAELCQLTGRYAAACALVAEALAADPRLANDLYSGERYHAARAASLAGCGRGKDAGALDEAARARWRGQALKWLRDDLASLARQLAERSPAVRVPIVEALRRWERELGHVRGEAALAAFPEAERRAWRELWADAEALLLKAGGKRRTAPAGTGRPAR
jgi:eukaryotic-like serine/threonine-protein kinase